MSDKEECCDICGDTHKIKYVQTLKCNHSYHYECIMKAFICDRKKLNQCPLCRLSHGLLPVVNGLPKLTNGIHFYSITNGLPEWSNVSCNSILQSGKRKGLQCDSKCMIGLFTCKRHHMAKLKKEDKDKDKPSTNQPWHDTLANYQKSS